MAVHTVRDYVIQNIAGSGRQFVPAYLLALFLRRILGYTYVGDTNYGINTVGSYLIATADSTPNVAPTFAVGTKAGINQGTSREFYVWVPPSVRTVQVADVNRLLVLKSTANPAFNSGVFLITGFESLNVTISSTSGTGVSPITITTSTPHTFTTGQTIVISGVTGNTNANGTWTITQTGANTFTIPATGNGTGSSGTANANSYIIDYRSMGSFPPVEAFDSMNWYLYAADSACPTVGNPNSTWPATYGGNGNSTTPRIIMQSPHALGWQVRICHETYHDSNRNFNSNGATGSVPCLTAIPGFGGNSFGDFAVGGQHLHTALYYSGTYDASAYGPNVYLAGSTPGFGEPAINSSTSFSYGSTPYRFTIVGDDGGQGVVFVARRPFDNNNPRAFILCFGLPENEPSPLPVNNVARLFCIGSGASTSNNGDYGNSLNNNGLTPGVMFNTSFGAGETHNNTCQGISQSIGGIPCSCVPAFWSYAVGSGNYGGPTFDGSAGDSPWTNGTELFFIDLINGTWASFCGGGATNSFLPYEPRMIGTIPHLRAGRANFDEYAATNDANRAFQHTKNGLYIVWNGPQVVP